MKILFVHQNFPAQFGRMAAWLTAQQQHQVKFLTRRDDVDFGNIQKVLFKEHRSAAETTHPYLRPVENCVIQGQAAYRSALQLKQAGFIPDVIYGHSGFGATMYMKDLFPMSGFVGFFEWYYHAHGGDADFGPDDNVTFDDECRIRTRNMMILPDLVACDAGVTPTYWQHRQFPHEFSAKLRVIHDGIDVRYFSPALGTKLVMEQPAIDLSGEKEIVTYVGRGMESMRGFPQFMAAMSLLMKRRKKCHVVIVGTDRVAYGPPGPEGKGLKEAMLKAYPFDKKRLHFTGPLPYGLYKLVLQASTVHVYLTKPFVLSWSMLEAMSCGCTLVASNTLPVQEVVTHNENGLLVDFFDAQKIADTVEQALTDLELRKKLGTNARETVVKRYDMQNTLPQHLRVLEIAAASR